MSSELSAKIQIVLWWITSIAVSVLCCSILFVLFASYLVDVKASVRDSDQRISVIEERQDRILSEIEMIRRHVISPPAAQQQPVAQPQAQAPTPAAPAVTDAPASLSISGAAPEKVDDAPVPAKPAAVESTGSATRVPATAPQIAVPVVPAAPVKSPAPATPEKK